MSPQAIFNVAVWVALFAVTAVKFVRSVRLVPNRREYIVERLGRYHRTLGPGFHVLVPFLDRVAYMQDLREESMEVPPQECFTKDNVKVEVDGVIYISVVDSKNASYGVTNYRRAAISLAQTTTRSVIGTLELDRTFEERDAINHRVISVLSEVSPYWGITVHRYEVKNIVTPSTVRIAMERQMGAERERRALLARSEGEKQSCINASEGYRAEVINRSEGAKQSRINQAEGRAQEILSIAQATADSIRALAGALSQPGGLEAMRLQQGQAYLGSLGKLGKSGQKVILPIDLTRLDDVLDAIRLDNDEARPLHQPPTHGRRPAPITAPPRRPIGGGDGGP